MLLISYVAKKKGYRTKMLGVIALVFTIIPFILVIAGFGRIEEAGTYILLIIFFVIGLFLYKPGFQRLKS